MPADDTDEESFSSFFFRTSAGLNMLVQYRTRERFSSFFFRTSAGHSKCSR